MPAILLRCNKIFGRAVNREIEGCFGGERFDAARRFGMRIFYDKIDMRLFVDVLKNGKAAAKTKTRIAATAQRPMTIQRTVGSANFISAIPMQNAVQSP